jgi:hypothetical protein
LGPFKALLVFDFQRLDVMWWGHRFREPLIFYFSCFLCQRKTTTRTKSQWSGNLQQRRNHFFRVLFQPEPFAFRWHHATASDGGIFEIAHMQNQPKHYEHFVLLDMIPEEASLKTQSIK